MTWSTLPTFSDGTALPYTVLEAIKANINESAAAKATTAGRHFATAGPNSIAEREIRQNYDGDAGTTTNSSFTNLSGSSPGPNVSNITTGPLALVVVECQVNNTNGGASSRMSYDITGATTSSATDDRGLLDQNSAGYDNRYATLELQAVTAGVNSILPKYRVSSGTGAFSARTCIVMAL